MRLLLRLVFLLLVASASTGRAHGVQLAAGGAWMANLNNELRVGATDLQLSWRHDFAWSALEAGVEWMLFFPAGRADPMVGARVGWSVFKDVGPLRPRVGVSAGAYWTRVSPVLPVGSLDVALEKPLGPWTVGVQVSGMLSLFGAGVQPRLFIGRSF